MVSPVSYHNFRLESNFESQLAGDQFRTILCLEESYRVPLIHCQSPIGEGGRHPYGEWRRKICQWSFKVIDHFKIDREVVSTAMNIFDRYLIMGSKSYDMDTCPCPECQRRVDSRTFQLAAMASLYLAMKISDSAEDHSSCNRKLRLQSFVELSRGQFRAEDITAMERVILEELRWKIHPPTPMTAVSYLLRLMPSYVSLPIGCRNSYDLVLHVLHELSRYLTELSVCLGSVCMSYTPCQVAYASILLSMELLTPAALPLEVRNAFNEAVVSTSSFAGGTILTPNDEAIGSLQAHLRHSFWPEMLMDDCDNAEVGHPISMAKDFGLLDVSCIMSKAPAVSPVANYYSQQQFYKNDLEDSPVCVSRQLS
mmetsp:Transcript_8745/g.15917  ORF Transcript_8745/g.15917 Transcript_8745/m.15917 type:complete len:368 (+) Transcript_8745:155-1258(+)